MSAARRAYTFAAGGFAATRKRCSSSFRVPTQTLLAKLAEADRRFRARHARRGRRRAVDARTEAGAQRSGESRTGRHVRREPRPARARRCGSRSPAWTRGTWVDPDGISRYVHVRLAAHGAREREPISGNCRSCLATAGAQAARRRSCRSSQVATITPELRAGADRPLPAPARRDDRRERESARRSATWRSDVMQRVNKVQLPPGYHIDPGRPDGEPEPGLRGHHHRARRRGDADVSHSRRAVRIVPRSAGDSRLAAAVADRRRRRAARSRATRSTS